MELEGGGMRSEEEGMPSGEELPRLGVPFGESEGRGMELEERGMRCEGLFGRREELFG